MNAVVRKPDLSLYVVSIWRDETEHIVVARCLQPDGSLRCESVRMSFVQISLARRKVREMVKMKIKRKKAVCIDPTELPDKALVHLAPPLDRQVTAAELVDMVKTASRERYVVVKDAAGLEDRFDEGVEYMAEDMGEPGFITVYDRYGKPCGLARGRLASVKTTELLEELTCVPGETIQESSSKESASCV